MTYLITHEIQPPIKLPRFCHSRFSMKNYDLQIEC